MASASDDPVRPHPRRVAPHRVASAGSHDVMGGLTVGEVMSSDLHTIASDAELRDARATFERLDIHHLFVEDGGAVVAILSDRDVLRSLSPYVGTNSAQRRDEATLHRKVFHAATYRLVTIREDALVQEAAALLLDRDISCLPVVDRDDRIVGIVTTRDLLRSILECVVPVTPPAARPADPRLPRAG